MFYISQIFRRTQFQNYDFLGWLVYTLQKLYLSPLLHWNRCRKGLLIGKLWPRADFFALKWKFQYFKINELLKLKEITQATLITKIMGSVDFTVRIFLIIILWRLPECQTKKKINFSKWLIKANTNSIAEWRARFNWLFS